MSKSTGVPPHNATQSDDIATWTLPIYTTTSEWTIYVGKTNYSWCNWREGNWKWTNYLTLDNYNTKRLSQWDSRQRPQTNQCYPTMPSCLQPAPPNGAAAHGHNLVVWGSQGTLVPCSDIVAGSGMYLPPCLPFLAAWSAMSDGNFG